MPATYEPIATTTISGSSTANVTFSSIPATYTDLIAVVNCGTSGGGSSLYGQLNGDTGGNYSWTYIYGNGTSAASGRFSNAGNFISGYYVTPATGFDFVSVTHFQNYANTTTNKTILSRANSTGSSYPGAEAMVSLWRNTAAINSIKFYIGTGNFVAGSTFTLYGVKNA
jgi:hypothetical protein